MTDQPKLSPSQQVLLLFAYEHLPADLQLVSRPFADLALAMEMLLPNGPEKTVALRKLLEGKDAAVRAYRFRPDNPETPWWDARDERGRFAPLHPEENS